MSCQSNQQQYHVQRMTNQHCNHWKQKKLLWTTQLLWMKGREWLLLWQLKSNIARQQQFKRWWKRLEKKLWMRSMPLTKISRTIYFFSKKIVRRIGFWIGIVDKKNCAQTVSTMFFQNVSDLFCNHYKLWRFSVNPGSKVTPLLTGFHIWPILHKIVPAGLCDPGTGLLVTCSLLDPLCDILFWFLFSFSSFYHVCYHADLWWVFWLFSMMIIKWDCRSWPFRNWRSKG